MDPEASVTAHSPSALPGYCPITQCAPVAYLGRAEKVLGEEGEEKDLTGDEVADFHPDPWPGAWKDGFGRWCGFVPWITFLHQGSRPQRGQGFGAPLPHGGDRDVWRTWGPGVGIGESGVAGAGRLRRAEGREPAC